MSDPANRLRHGFRGIEFTGGTLQAVAHGTEARGEKGRVTAPLERLLAEDNNAIVYSCGPDGMLHAVSNVSQAVGVPCQLALEAPMACGMGTCKGCTVMGTDGTYKYVCYDGPVFEAADIFEAAS